MKPPGDRTAERAAGSNCITRVERVGGVGFGRVGAARQVAPLPLEPRTQTAALRGWFAFLLR
ncbi:MAG TPA: hypothetical protein PKL11_11335, partial [Anaerolineaceae bacterium]|nr:hypothetical protein [Anaerolineaceae bacterium]